MHWQDRHQGLARIVVRLSTGMVLGLVPALLYGSLVAAVQFGVSGRWGRTPAFLLTGVIVGALLGLLGGVVWALSGHSAPVSPRAAQPPRLTRQRIGRIFPARAMTAAARSSRRERQWERSEQLRQWQ
jgi:hypothetical protein